MFDRATVLCVMAAAVLVTAGSASGGFIATDLNTGGADEGFSGGWVGSGNVFIVDASDLTYANYAITQTGTTQKVYSGNTAHADRMDSHNLAVAMSGEMWFSALVNVPSTATYAGLTFNNFNAGQPWNPIDTDARILLGPTQLQVGFNSAAGTTPGTGAFAPDTTHLILGQMNVVAGNDTLNVWIDPDVNALSSLGDLGAANFTSTTVDFTDSIQNLGVAGRASFNGDPNRPFIDAIRLSDSDTAFFDVTGVELSGGGNAVPEPATATLAMLGLGGLMMRRRHNA